MPAALKSLPEKVCCPTLSLTVVRFHIESERQVLVPAQQPAVTGCCHVQHQPALVPSSERLKIQKQQVRLPVDMKKQLTESRHSCLCISSAHPGDAVRGTYPTWLGVSAPCAFSHFTYCTKCYWAQQGCGNRGSGAQ